MIDPRGVGRHQVLDLAGRALELIGAVILTCFLAILYGVHRVRCWCEREPASTGLLIFAACVLAVALALSAALLL